MFGKIVTAAKRLEKNIADTVCESAVAICEAIWDQVGDECTQDTAGKIAEAIVADMPKGPARDSRKTEWKAFAYAVQFGLDDAVKYAKREHKLTRVLLFKIARAMKDQDYGSHKAVVDQLFAKLNSNQPTGRGATFGMGLGIIKNLDKIDGLSKAKTNEFRRKLAALCSEYGLKY